MVIAIGWVDYSNPMAKDKMLTTTTTTTMITTKEERGRRKDEGRRGQIGSRKCSEQRQSYDGNIFFFLHTSFAYTF